MEIEKRTSVGVLIKCVKTNKIFLVLRNDKRPVWSLVSGMLEENEEPLKGLKREIKEELSINTSILGFKPIKIYNVPEKNETFHYYVAFTLNEFSPILDHENLDWGWFTKDELPSPLYKGLLEKIQEL